MRLLLDQNVPRSLASLLADHGWDVVHASDVGLSRASDDDVLAAARADRRVLVTADTDFGRILARSGASTPSVIEVRKVSGRRATDLAPLLTRIVPECAAALEAGAIVAVEDNRTRTQLLPLR